MHPTPRYSIARKALSFKGRAVRLRRLSIPEFLDIVKNTKPDTPGHFPYNTILNNGCHVRGIAKVGVHRQRIQLFTRSLACAACGCQAKYVWLEINNLNNYILVPYAPKHGGETPLTVDHIRPRSLGGNSKKGNLQVLCQPCNQFKGNRTISIQDLRKERCKN